MSLMQRARLANSSPLLRKFFRPRLLTCFESPNGEKLDTYDLIGFHRHDDASLADKHPDILEEPTYRAVSRMLCRHKKMAPTSRRCGYDVLQHAPPPHLLLEWQIDPFLQVPNAPDSLDFRLTHHRHKRYVCPSKVCPCPRPPQLDPADKRYWLSEGNSNTHIDQIYEDFMLGNWVEVNLLNEANESPEPCDDSIEIPELDAVLMRRHRKFWVRLRLDEDEQAIPIVLPDIMDHADHPTAEAHRAVPAPTCFEYSHSTGLLWVVGVPGTSCSNHGQTFHFGRGKRSPLYFFPLANYVAKARRLICDKGPRHLNEQYLTRLNAATIWARSALRSVSPIFLRNPHLIVSLEQLHTIQRVAFVHLITTITNGECILHEDLRWHRAQNRVGFTRSPNERQWRKYATAVFPSQDAMLVYTTPGKVKCRIVCLRSGQASKTILLPTGVGRGILLVPPL